MLHTGFTTCLVMVLLAGVSAAEPDPAPSPRHGASLTPLFGSDVGLDIAAGLQIELPIRVRFTGTAGWVPGGYAWMLEKYYTDVYDGREAVGELLKETVKNAFVARGMVGVRPLAQRGFFFDATYTFVRSEKEGLVAGLIESVSNLGISEEGGPNRTFETTVTVHMLGAQLGWQWGLGTGWSLRASLGFITIMSSTTSIEPSFTPVVPELDARIRQAAEARLEDAGEGIVSPLGSLFLGYTL